VDDAQNRSSMPTVSTVPTDSRHTAENRGTMIMHFSGPQRCCKVSDHSRQRSGNCEDTKQLKQRREEKEHVWCVCCVVATNEASYKMNPPLRIVKYNRPPEAEPPRPTRGFITMGCPKPWRSRCQCNTTDAEITGKNSGIYIMSHPKPQ
jgi:hypothetical protein